VHSNAVPTSSSPSFCSQRLFAASTPSAPIAMKVTRAATGAVSLLGEGLPRYPLQTEPLDLSTPRSKTRILSSPPQIDTGDSGRGPSLAKKARMVCEPRQLQLTSRPSIDSPVAKRPTQSNCINSSTSLIDAKALRSALICRSPSPASEPCGIRPAMPLLPASLRPKRKIGRPSDSACVMGLRPRRHLGPGFYQKSSELFINSLLNRRGADGLPIVKRIFELQAGTLVYPVLFRKSEYSGEIIVHDENPFLVHLMKEIIHKPTEIIKEIHSKISLIRKAGEDLGFNIREDLTICQSETSPEILKNKRADISISPPETRLETLKGEIHTHIHKRLRSLINISTDGASSISSSEFDRHQTETAALIWIVHQHEWDRSGVFCKGEESFSISKRFVIAPAKKTPEGNFTVFKRKVDLSNIVSDFGRASAAFSKSSGDHKATLPAIDVKTRASQSWVEEAREGDFVVMHSPTDSQIESRFRVSYSEDLLADLTERWVEGGVRIAMVGLQSAGKLRTDVERIGFKTFELAVDKRSCKYRRTKPMTDLAVAVNFDLSSPVAALLDTRLAVAYRARITPPQDQTQFGEQRLTQRLVRHPLGHSNIGD
jgi:hypothetical protein